jgi:hypothetical protein
MIAAARKLADDVLKEPEARYEVVTKSKSGRRVLAAKAPLARKRATRRAWYGARIDFRVNFVETLILLFDSTACDLEGLPRKHPWWPTDP